jgi:hypothetical protein
MSSSGLEESEALKVVPVLSGYSAGKAEDTLGAQTSTSSIAKKSQESFVGQKGGMFDENLTSEQYEHLNCVLAKLNGVMGKRSLKVQGVQVFAERSQLAWLWNSY